MIKLIWYKDGMNNWGDYLPPVLVNYITGEEPTFVKYNDMSPGIRYIMVGSIMCHIFNPETVVWGTGFMWSHSKIPVKPKKIYAVRGPLTRKLLLQQNIDCPEIYGDPALLFPRFYNPNIQKKYKLGIIPHYVDAEYNWVKQINDSSIRILNIRSETHEFINELLSCEKIISSSLHGLIAADAYNIPCMWVKMTDKVGGNGFKFLDYFASVNRDDTMPYEIVDNTRIENVYDAIPKYNIQIDLEALYESCPIKKTK